MIATHRAREQITIDGTVKTLTASNIDADTIYANLQFQSYQVRQTIDGATDPVATTTGVLRNPGDERCVWGGTNLKNLRFTKEGSNSGVLVVNYWGRGA